ncbi:hypothetical protein B0T20DRAFT_395162 [Sordaria brevicollis]|uniref:Transmembrane protein n=1 Tax=Sordaria brevicollis TaxID=83679 RepID=A0AAE0UA47_SORBR|nr:hypothetical protein B0T20DRAFT_395162 [Sordaria brevicollis]
MKPHLLRHFLVSTFLLGLAAASALRDPNAPRDQPLSNEISRQTASPTVGVNQEDGQPYHDPLPPHPPSDDDKKNKHPNTGEIVGYSILGLVGLAAVVGVWIGLRKVGRMRAQTEEIEMSNRRRRNYYY